MKIGIMGAHGTGKTTLARALEKSLGAHERNVAMVTEVARSCEWPINQETTEESQRWIYHRHMLMELEASARAEIVICDRTAMDSLVYAAVAGMGGVVQDYLDPALAWMATYDQIYWMRPCPGRLVADGRRDVDLAFQKRVDLRFKLWIQQFEILVVELKPNKEANDEKRESSEGGGCDQGGADPGSEGYPAH